MDAIFSANRRCGAPRRVSNWGDLGLQGFWARRPIQMFGRNSASGTYGFFKDLALCGGDFSSRVNQQPGSASVVQAVATAVNGIGYSPLGYRTASVRAVPLSAGLGRPFVEASATSATSGEYPLSRFMYIYVNRVPGRSLAPLESEFLRMVLSRKGQDIVRRDGYIPLPADVADRALETLSR